MAIGKGSKMSETDDTKAKDQLHDAQAESKPENNMLLRLVYLLLIAIMISLAQTILGVATVVQFIVMLLNNKQPNERLAEFGTKLGTWIAKAARFQTAASEVKPWPWSELD